MEALDASGNVICSRCGIQLTEHNKSKDHFIPQSFYNNPHGESYLYCGNNIVYICKECNSSIGNKPKTPDWYTYLPYECKSSLYNGITLFISDARKTDCGRASVDYYMQLLIESGRIIPKVKRMTEEEFNKRESDNKVKHYAYPKKNIKGGFNNDKDVRKL